MPKDLPIACALAPGKLSERLAEMTRLGAESLLEVRRSGVGAELVFAEDGKVRQRLDAIVAAEAQCCAFLRMQVTEGDGVITLGVKAPDGAEIAVSEIVDAFGGRPRPAAR